MGIELQFYRGWQYGRKIWNCELCCFLEVALVIFLSDNWIFILSLILFAITHNESSDNVRHRRKIAWRKNEVNNLIIRIDGALGKKNKHGSTTIRKLNSENVIVCYAMTYCSEYMNLWIMKLWVYEIWTIEFEQFSWGLHNTGKKITIFGNLWTITQEWNVGDRQMTIFQLSIVKVHFLCGHFYLENTWIFKKRVLILMVHHTLLNRHPENAKKSN